mmetsp:Transcript_28011/g.70334  ORF Transcript_28011/g.70334 Transcript_28011/m.70334 type:complete len:202 (-) Transcript_28011:86-691(-)
MCVCWTCCTTQHTVLTSPFPEPSPPSPSPRKAPSRPPPPGSSPTTSPPSFLPCPTRTPSLARSSHRRPRPTRAACGKRKTSGSGKWRRRSLSWRTRCPHTSSATTRTPATCLHTHCRPPRTPPLPQTPLWQARCTRRCPPRCPSSAATTCTCCTSCRTGRVRTRARKSPARCGSPHPSGAPLSRWRGAGRLPASPLPRVVL